MREMAINKNDIVYVKRPDDYSIEIAYRISAQSGDSSFSIETWQLGMNKQEYKALMDELHKD